MAQAINQTTGTRRTNRTRTASPRARAAGQSASAAVRPNDGVTLSRGAQVAAVTNQVRSVFNMLGFSPDRATTGTTRTTSPQRNLSASARANLNQNASRVGSAVSGTVATSGSGRSALSRGLEVADALSILNPVTAPLTIGRRAATLVGVETGMINPENGSRLGAYEATAGNARGTTGRAAHNSIGAIYMLLGNFGQDRIGTVFNSQEARSLYDQSLSNGSSRQLAETEYRYWDQQRRENGSAGGIMGSMFSPAVRDGIQQVMGRI